MKKTNVMNDVTISQVCELTINYSQKIKNSLLPAVHSSSDVYNYVVNNGIIKGINHRESMICLMLSRANKILGYALIGLGGIAGTVCDPRLVFQIALKANAPSIIMCHNHPSGNEKPSEADIKLTQKIKDGAKLLDISLHDHLIVTDELYYSFADQGMM